MVVEVRKNAGEMVGPGEALFHVVDVDRLRVTGQLNLADYWRVKVGQRVRVWPELDGEELAVERECFEGRVVFVDSRIDPETRTARVVTEVANRDGLLASGLEARMEIIPEPPPRRRPRPPRRRPRQRPRRRRRTRSDRDPVTSTATPPHREMTPTGAGTWMSGPAGRTPPGRVLFDETADRPTTPGGPQPMSTFSPPESASAPLLRLSSSSSSSSTSSTSSSSSTRGRSAAAPGLAYEAAKRARRGRGGAADRGVGALDAGPGRGGEADQPRPGRLPPHPARPSRPALRLLQVPHHGRRRRGAPGDAATTCGSGSRRTTRSRTTRG